MKDNRYLEDYYSNYNEEGRLLSKHGEVEYTTTMTYIHKYLQPGMRILEVGAGTGRYSLALAHEGYQVDAIELVPHNLEILKSKIQEGDVIHASQGDALDLSRYADDTFHITLVLGPMYHLYGDGDKVKALKEAVRVTKKDGFIYVAYCMNEATILCYCFIANKIHECLEKHMLTDDYHCLSAPKDLFELVRVEDIHRITAQVKVERISLLATDGAANYMRDTIDQMDEATFKLYMDYHLKTCERQDLIGASHHTLDILRKV